MKEIAYFLHRKTAATDLRVLLSLTCALSAPCQHGPHTKVVPKDVLPLGVAEGSRKEEVLEVVELVGQLTSW